MTVSAEGSCYTSTWMNTCGSQSPTPRSTDTLTPSALHHPWLYSLYYIEIFIISPFNFPPSIFFIFYFHLLSYFQSDHLLINKRLFYCGVRLGRTELSTVKRTCLFLPAFQSTLFPHHCLSLWLHFCLFSMRENLTSYLREHQRTRMLHWQRGSNHTLLLFSELKEYWHWYQRTSQARLNHLHTLVYEATGLLHLCETLNFQNRCFEKDHSRLTVSKEGRRDAIYWFAWLLPAHALWTAPKAAATPDAGPTTALEMDGMFQESTQNTCICL